MKGRDVIVKTEIPDIDLPKLSGDLKVDKVTLPDGGIKNMLNQKFKANAELPLPKLSGADIDDIKLPDGSIKTSFKPKAGFKWPKISLPELQFPDWQFGSGERSPSPERKRDKDDSEFSFGMKMPSFGFGGKGPKIPKFEGLDGMLGYLLPKADLPKLRIRDNTEVDVIDLPDLKGRDVIVKTEIPDIDLPKLSGDLKVDKVTLPDGGIKNILNQKFKANAELPLPKLSGADIDDIKLPDGSIKTSFKPKAGFKWPKISLPEFDFPDWQFGSGDRSPSPERKQSKGDHEFHLGMKMPSFGFGGKGPKIPKFDGLDSMLGYLLPKADLPKLRIRDNTEVDVIDLPDMKGRDVIVRTEIPDMDLPKLSGDLKVDKVTLPDGGIKNMLNQKFKANAELPLPKLSGADIEDIKLPDGSIKTSFKPKAGFKWPKISLPEFDFPDWQFGSGDRSPSPERKQSKGDHDFHLGMKMPSFGFGGKGPKIPKFDGLDGMLGYLLPKEDLPKLRIRDNTEVHVIDLPDMKGRDVIVKTEIPDIDLPKLSGDLKVDKVTLPDGGIKNMLNQKFKANAELPLPKLSGADIEDIKLPDGSIKTSFKPKAGFKWPKISLPSLQMPDWEFSSGDISPGTERKSHSFGLKMPSMSWKGKAPKLSGIGDLLAHLVPKAQLPRIQFRDNSEVHVLDLPDGRRRLQISTEVPEADLPNLPTGADVEVTVLPDGSKRRVWRQSFDVDADFELPAVEGAEMEEVKLPDGGVQVSYKPKGGFKWPDIHLPKFHLPDWEFRSKDSPSKDEHDSSFGLKMPSFGFGKGSKVPKVEGIDGLLAYLLPEADLPKLRIRDNTEVDVIDLPDMTGRSVIVETDIPDVDLPKLSGDLQVDNITLPGGDIKNVLRQTFEANAELPLPKISGADIDDIKLPDGSIKTSFKPKAGFSWPKISLPTMQMPDWEFSSGRRSPSPERKHGDHHFSMKMPSFGFGGKGVKPPKMNGLDSLLAYLLPEKDIPKLRLTDSSEVDVIDLPDMKGREIVVKTEVPEVNIASLPAGLKIEPLTLPDGKVKKMLNQKFDADASLVLPKVAGAQIDDVKMSDGSIKTSFKPKAGFKWPDISIPTLEMPDWEFSSGSKAPDAATEGVGDSHFGMKLPSFGFGKGVKVPKVDGLDGLLHYLLPKADIPKLRIRDDTEVDVIDLPDMKGREVVLTTDVPEAEVPKLSGDLKVKKVTLPDGTCKQILTQMFQGDAELPLPKVSGADIGHVKLPDGSLKTSYRPKAGFKWPKIKLPHLHMPDWEFGAGRSRSPSPEKESREMTFGMPSFSVKGKIPDFDGIGDFLHFSIPKANFPSLNFRDNSTVDFIDLPSGKRQLVIDTELSDAELPDLPADARIETIDLPGGGKRRVWRQYFDVDADMELPEIEGTEKIQTKLPDGSVKWSYKPKGGFKWPEIHMPRVQLPDWKLRTASGRSMSPPTGKKDVSFHMKMPSFGFGKGVKVPKLDGIDGLLGYLLPEGDLPKVRIRDNTELDVIDLPEAKGRDVVIRTEIPDVDLPKLSADLDVQKVTLPDGTVSNILNQKFSADAKVPLPKVSGADIDDIKLPDGSLKTTFKPKAGFSWPEITLPSLQLPDWEFSSGGRSKSASLERKGSKNEHDSSFGFRMPSFGFKKGVKAPKFDGIDELLGYLLPEKDIPKLRIRDDTEVDVIDFPKLKKRDVVIRTQIPDTHLPNLPSDLKCDSITLPDGGVKNVLNQQFEGNFELPLPKMSGVDVGDVKQPDGSRKVTFKPKAGFKWPKIKLPTLELPDWEFGSGDDSPSTQRKTKDDQDFHVGLKMPSFGMKKSVKTPKFDSIDGLLGYLLPAADISKVKLSSNSEVDVLDLPEMKGREVVIRTDIPEVELSKLPTGLQVEKLSLPDGTTRNELTQKFRGNAELHLPKVSGADITDMKLPDGSLKTTFRPKAGFKWPQFTLPSLEMPDWEFRSGDKAKSASLERSDSKGDRDFGLKMPSFGFKKGVKIPKFDGVDGLLGYLLPEADIPKLRIRDNTEVDVIDLPGMKGRDVIVKTEIPDADLPKLSGELKVDKITLPDGGIKNMLNQKFKANAELQLPKLPGADIEDVKLPDGSIKTSFKPKAGFKWPKITLPSLVMPDWEFDSGDRGKRTSLERGMKLPSFGFKKGVKAPKFDGLDGMLGYLLPEVDIPKLRIRDNSEVDVVDLPDGKRDIYVRTEIPDADLPKLSGDLKVETITLPDGSVKNILNQTFKGNGELALPKVHGADIDDVKLPNGSLKTTFKPKAGFKWPKFTLPTLDLPDWEFSSSEKSASLERKEPKGDHDFHMGIKMPSFGFKKGVKTPKFDGVDGLLGYLLQESDLPSLKIRDSTEVDVLDIPSVKTRDVVVRTEIPDVDLPKLSGDLKVDRIPLPDGTVRNELTQKYKGNFDLTLPKVSGADVKEVELPDGGLKTTFKPKAGFKWPTITLPSLQMPDWEFHSGERSPPTERKEKNGDGEFSLGVKMPSFGMKKGVKVPKCEGIDDLLGYLLPEAVLPKLRIRDNTEVDVIDLPHCKDRKISVRTEVPEVELPKLSADLKVEKLTLPDGNVKNLLTQTFNGNVEQPLPKVSGADIDDIQLPDGSLKTTFKPKAGFKWPKIKLPSLQMPDWEFGSGDRSPSPERKGDGDFSLGIKMPSFGFGKGIKVPKVRGIDGLLTYVLPEADIPKLRIRDNSEVDIVEIPDLSARDVIVRTEIPEADVPKLSGKFDIPTVSTPDGQIKHVLTQQFSSNPELPLPKVGGADIDSMKMTDGALKTTYKPKAGFAWPKIKLPSLSFPDWDFSSGGEKPDAESDDDGDDFEFSLPSFGLGKGAKPPKLHGIDALLAYLIPEKDVPSLRIREDTEVDVIDFTDRKIRDVHVRSNIPDIDIPKLPSNLTVENNVLTQKFNGNFDLVLPKVTGAEVDDINLPSGALKTTYKPKAGMKWPEISLPTLEMPGWKFRTSDRSPSPERKVSKESEHHFGIRMPSFGFKKGVKTPKFDSIDGLLGYLLPDADLPKLRIKDDTEVDIIDDADPKTRSVVVRTSIPDADLPKLPAGLKVNKLTFPDGSIRNVLEQSFVGNAELHLPKVSGADINETKLHQGSTKTTYRPKVGTKWPRFSLPQLQMPDWQFSSETAAPQVTAEGKDSKGDHDFHLGMKMPSFGFKKGAKPPKFDGIDGLLGYLLPKSDIPSLRIRDNTEVDVIDLPNAKGREVVARTDVPDADLPKLPVDLKVNKITLPNNQVRNELTQKYAGNAELVLPKVSGAVTDDVKLPDGSIKTTYKPKPGFKWPKLSLPGLQMPDWEFRTEETTKENSSSLERGMQLPSFGFKKSVKVPKLDGVDGLLAYLLPESDLVKLRIRDNTEVDVIDLPEMKGREVVVSTDIPSKDLSKLSADLKTEKVTLPDGKIKNLLTQKFKGNVELPLPKVSGADIDDVKLPNGSIKTSFKPKAGFKWPKISLPSLQLPDWEFGSGERSPSPERKEKGDSDFSFGVKMPSFGFGKGAKVPKLDGVDGLLGYLLPESDVPKLRIRDDTEVDVIDLPDMKGREVVVKTDIPAPDLPKLSADLKTEKITLPDGNIKNLLTQTFKANAELPLPKVSGADIDDVKLPNGSIKTSFKPKAGFKWPKISLPSLQLPDWEFGSGERSPSPERKEKGDGDFSFGVKMPSFGFGKGTKVPKLDGVDGLLGYLLPESDLPKLRIRDNTEVDVIDLPDMKGREVIVRTDIPAPDLPKLSADLKTDKITLPDGNIKNLLTQTFKANAELPLPKVSGADIDDVKLPNGSIKTSFKPKAGFKWPKISLPSLQLPDWEFGSGERSPSPERKEKEDSDFSFGVKMPSFGFGKGAKVPKLDGVDGLLGYLLPESDVPKLRIRDDTEVDVIDLPDMKGREVVVRTDIPAPDLPKLSADLKTERITLPDGNIKNLLTQTFKANAELPLPKVSGADIDDVKLPNGSIKTSFKPKAGFKWPKISLPSLQLPDWEFGSGERSPSPERKEKEDSDFSFGVKMPSFGFGKGAKVPKLDGVDGLLGYLLPESDLPKLRIRDNTEVDVIDLPDMKGREVVVRTDIPAPDLPKLSADLKTDKITLPDGNIKNLLTQKFKANAELPLPKVSGADIDDVKLPNGSIKTSFKPKAGFKWPKISLPSLQLPDWEFGSGERSPSPERKEKGDGDFSFGVKMPSFGFGKGTKVPKLDGVDGLLGYLLPESDVPKLRIRDDTEVDVIDLPDMKGREVVVRTDIPAPDLPKLSADLKTEKITLPDGNIKNLLTQTFKANAELPLPKVSGADIDDVKLPNGSIKTSFKPKAGFKWPKISLPSLQLPDWEFGSGERSPSPERKEKGDGDFSFGVKMPSFGFGKGTKVPKLDGVDGLLGYLLPESDVPKLRIRDDTEVDVIDLPDMKGREVVVRTDIPAPDLPKLSADLKTEKITLPDGNIKNLLTQTFKANAELPLPKVSGADIDDVKLPNGSIKTSFKPKAGFKWPKISLPSLQLPDWEFGSGERSPSPERKEKGDSDFSFGVKMPSFGFGKGAKVPKLDGVDGLLGYLLPESDVLKLRIRDDTEVDVIDLPDMKGREVVVRTDIPAPDLPKLSADLKTEKITLPDGNIKNLLTQTFKANAELPLPKVSGADIDDVKLPNGSIKTSFKPKAGFKWPKISLPSLQLPDWEFGSGERSPSPERKEKGDGDFSFGVKMPSFGFGKGVKVPKLDGVDGLLGYLLPESDVPKLRIRDDTEVDVIDLPDMKGREVVVRTDIPAPDLPKLSADLKTEKITLPDGKIKNLLTQTFKANAELPLPKVSGADIDDVKLPNGSIKTSFKPKAGFKWPKISLPSLQLPDWEFGSGERSPSLERKEKEDSDFSFGVKMPSFGFGKGAKVPKLDGVDGLLGYLLPESDLPKLRIRDNTEVDVIDLPDMKGREVVVRTDIPAPDLPKLSGDLKTEKITLPDGKVKNLLTQTFKANAELPLPKVSGADIDDVKLPNGSIKTSFKPKAGFKWPKISLPSLQLPDWEFGSGERSPSPERKEKGDSDFSFGVKMPSFGFGKGAKVPKLDGVDGLLGYLLPESDVPKLRIRDDTEVDVIDLPDMKGREVVVRTDIPAPDLPKLSADLKTERITLPDGKIKNLLTQKFKANAELPLPKVSGANIDDVKLPNGSIKTSFKPKAGFKWPKISLPSLQLPDWEFGSGGRSPSPERKEKGDGDFSFGVRMPSLGKGTKVPNLKGLDALLAYLIPEPDVAKLRLRDNTEVDVLDRPDSSSREVIVRTELPAVRPPKLPAGVKVEKVSLPAGGTTSIMVQEFKGDAALPLPKVSGADVIDSKLPDGTMKSTFKPKAGLKWPTITLPVLEIPDWEFSSEERERSPERKEKGDSDFHFGVKMPSFGFGKGVKAPKVDGLDHLLGYLLPADDLPKLRIRDSSEVDVIDLPDMKGREVVVRTDIPETDLPKLSYGLKTEMITLPDGKTKHILNQKFNTNAELPLPKVSGADIEDVKLPDGSIKTSFKPKAGFKWPKITLPSLHLPDWHFGGSSGSYSPPSVRKEATAEVSATRPDKVSDTGIDGIGDLVMQLIPRNELPSLVFADTSEVRVEVTGPKKSDLFVITNVTDVDVPELTPNAKIDTVNVPGGGEDQILTQKFRIDPTIAIPDVVGAKVEETKLKDGTVRFTYKPCRGLKWPEIHMPLTSVPTKEVRALRERSLSPVRDERDSGFSFKLPSFSFKKGVKPPKLSGVDGLLEYLLPKEDIPKLRIRDNTEVDVIDIPGGDARDVEVRTEISEADVKLLPEDSDIVKISLPDGKTKHTLCQNFRSSPDLPLPRVSGADISEVTLPNGNVKATYKPKSGFKWPKISLPSLQLPDWEFRSGDGSPSPERKVSKSVKKPKFDGISELLAGLIPKAKLPSIEFRENSTIDVEDLPSGKRQLVITTEVTEPELSELPKDAKVEVETLPSGKTRKVWRQYFDVDPDFQLPEIEGAELEELVMPDGGVRTTYKPKGGFKWPEFHLPKFHLPGWEFKKKTSDAAEVPEKKKSKQQPVPPKKPMKRPPNFLGIDGVLEYLIPEDKLAKLRLRDTTEVDVIDLQRIKVRDVIVRTEVQKSDIPKLPPGVTATEVTRPSGRMALVIEQPFKADADLVLPTCSSSDITETDEPDGSRKTTYRPRKGAKWPKLKIPALQVPDWEFRSSKVRSRSPSPTSDDEGRFSFSGLFSRFLPSFSKDKAEIEVEDDPVHGQQFVVKTEVPDEELKNIPADAQIEVEALPDGRQRRVWRQPVNTEISLDSPEIELKEETLPDGRVRKTVKPKAGFEWPSFSFGFGSKKQESEAPASVLAEMIPEEQLPKVKFLDTSELEVVELPDGKRQAVITTEVNDTNLGQLPAGAKIVEDTAPDGRKRRVWIQYFDVEETYIMPRFETVEIIEIVLPDGSKKKTLKPKTGVKWSGIPKPIKRKPSEQKISAEKAPKASKIPVREGKSPKPEPSKRKSSKKDDEPSAKPGAAMTSFMLSMVHPDGLEMVRDTMVGAERPDVSLEIHAGKHPAADRGPDSPSKKPRPDFPTDDAPVPSERKSHDRESPSKIPKKVSGATAGEPPIRVRPGSTKKKTSPPPDSDTDLSKVISDSQIEKMLAPLDDLPREDSPTDSERDSTKKSKIPKKMPSVPPRSTAKTEPHTPPSTPKEEYDIPPAGDIHLHQVVERTVCESDDELDAPDPASVPLGADVEIQEQPDGSVLRIYKRTIVSSAADMPSMHLRFPDYTVYEETLPDGSVQRTVRRVITTEDWGFLPEGGQVEEERQPDGTLQKVWKQVLKPGDPDFDIPEDADTDIQEEMLPNGSLVRRVSRRRFVRPAPSADVDIPEGAEVREETLPDGSVVRRIIRRTVITSEEPEFEVPEGAEVSEEVQPDGSIIRRIIRRRVVTTTAEEPDFEVPEGAEVSEEVQPDGSIIRRIIRRRVVTTTSEEPEFEVPEGAEVSEEVQPDGSVIRRIIRKRVVTTTAEEPEFEVPEGAEVSEEVQPDGSIIRRIIRRRIVTTTAEEPEFEIPEGAEVSEEVQPDGSIIRRIIRRRVVTTTSEEPEFEVPEGAEVSEEVQPDGSVIRRIIRKRVVTTTAEEPEFEVPEGAEVSEEVQPDGSIIRRIIRRRIVTTTAEEPEFEIPEGAEVSEEVQPDGSIIRRIIRRRVVTTTSEEPEFEVPEGAEVSEEVQPDGSIIRRIIRRRIVTTTSEDSGFEVPEGAEVSEEVQPDGSVIRRIIKRRVVTTTTEQPEFEVPEGAEVREEVQPDGSVIRRIIRRVVTSSLDQEVPTDAEVTEETLPDGSVRRIIRRTVVTSTIPEADVPEGAEFSEETLPDGTVRRITRRVIELPEGAPLPEGAEVEEEDTPEGRVRRVIHRRIVTTSEAPEMEVPEGAEVTEETLPDGSVRRIIRRRVVTTEAIPSDGSPDDSEVVTETLPDGTVQKTIRRRIVRTVEMPPEVLEQIVTGTEGDSQTEQTEHTSPGGTRRIVRHRVVKMPTIDLGTQVVQGEPTRRLEAGIPEETDLPEGAEVHEETLPDGTIRRIIRRRIIRNVTDIDLDNLPDGCTVEEQTMPDGSIMKVVRRRTVRTVMTSDVTSVPQGLEVEEQTLPDGRLKRTIRQPYDGVAPVPSGARAVEEPDAAGQSRQFLVWEVYGDDVPDSLRGLLDLPVVGGDAWRLGSDGELMSSSDTPEQEETEVLPDGTVRRVVRRSTVLTTQFLTPEIDQLASAEPQVEEETLPDGSVHRVVRRTVVRQVSPSEALPDGSRATRTGAADAEGTWQLLSGPF